MTRAYPAIHVAFFGVFPDKDIGPDMTESFTATRAYNHAGEIARAARIRDDQAERLFNGQGNEEDLEGLGGIEEALDAQDTMRAAVNMRMRTAYQIAAREGWIKPVSGAVFLADRVSDDEEPLNAALESAALIPFSEFVNGQREPDFLHTALHLEDMPVAMMAYIRCVVGGQNAVFSAFTEATELFKSVTPPYPEPDLDLKWFNLAAVDTVAMMNADPARRHGRLMGFGGDFPAPKPGPKPAP